jgi:hypothetical protein
MEVIVLLDNDSGSGPGPLRLIYPRRIPRDEAGIQHGHSDCSVRSGLGPVGPTL